MRWLTLAPHNPKPGTALKTAIRETVPMPEQLDFQ